MPNRCLSIDKKSAMICCGDDADGEVSNYLVVGFYRLANFSPVSHRTTTKHL